jgi:hypothetical protein
MNLPPRQRLLLVALAGTLALAGLAALLAPNLASRRLRAMAHARGLEATWQRFTYRFPARVAVHGLVLRTAASGDTLLVADDVDVTLRMGALLLGHARPARVGLSGARVRLRGNEGALADTLAPGESGEDVTARPIAASVRRRADAFVRALLVPARTLPELHLLDLEIARGDQRLTLSGLDLTHEPTAENLAATGTLYGERDMPFDVLLRWQRDDRLTGRAEFRVGDSLPPSPATLLVVVDGRVTQDRHAREVRILDGTQVRIGTLTAGVAGRFTAAGPRFQLGVAADGLTGERFRRSLPASMLGPLAGLSLRGTFDWHAGFDLDLAKPDSVRFHADVIPHGLLLDPAESRPSLAVIAGPFIAAIHLPRDRVVTRGLSDANPHYRPLARISAYLRDGVVTNEDGGFWRHRGFNTEAIGLAVAANLRAGSYKRGAGTITMQLARNLWLGHRRTLSRKGQEVALAWLLEHETGLSKERLLEVYLNIIEWGPGVHGADEAARYYFDEDASQLSLPEALFLTIVVPSPTRWRWRLGPDGTLRPYARAQMHYIASKMAAKGWLDPAQVPPADSLRITLRGPARALFAAPDSVAAAADSVGAGPI